MASYGQSRSRAGWNSNASENWLPCDVSLVQTSEPTLKLDGCTTVVLGKSPRGKLIVQHVDENGNVVSKNILRGVKR